ncbi:MAG TPA: XdhC family protein [Polyangia bacterium]|nr:XdhC family protein [Polyangia bacterium]
MRGELIDLAARLARAGEPFALATVVARSPPISAQVGDTALVTADGGFHGWVGGSCTRPTVIAEAQNALADGRPRLVALCPDPTSRRRPGLTVFPMTCHSGGSVEIHIQPVLPPARLLIYGLSPTARALVRLGKAMGYAVTVIDAAAEAADFPEADAVLSDPAALARAAFASAAPRYAVVATQGQWDEEATAAALALDPPPAYLGVMASGKRFGEMRALLAERAGQGAIDRIKNPAGLDLGATTPEEIAVSILAEIVARRAGVARAVAVEGTVAAPGSPTPTPTPTPAPTPTGGQMGRRSRSLAQAQAPVMAGGAAGEGQAIDPVCGMTVAIAGAAHRAEHAGQSYYFCCGGCRARFLAAPASFLAQEAAR